MIHKIKMLFLILAVTVVSSCELDLLDNPNAVTVSNADINYLLNSVTAGYAGNFNGFSDPGMRLTRMLNQGSVIYDNPFPLVVLTDVGVAPMQVFWLMFQRP